MNIRSAQPDARVLVLLASHAWQAHNRLAGASLLDRDPATGQPIQQTALYRPLDHERFGFAGVPDLRWRLHGPAAAPPLLDMMRSFDSTAACLDSQDLAEGRLDELRPDLLVVAGADEYWTAEMRQAVDRHLATGRPKAVFDAGICWWRAHVEDGVLTVNRWRSRLGPAESVPEGAWCWIRPEEESFALSYRFGGIPIQGSLPPSVWRDRAGLSLADYEASAGMRAERVGHPVFAGTCLDNRDQFGVAPGLVRYRLDGLPLRTNTRLPEIDRARAGSSAGQRGNRRGFHRRSRLARDRTAPETAHLVRTRRVAALVEVEIAGDPCRQPRLAGRADRPRQAGGPHGPKYRHQSSKIPLTGC